MKNKVIGGLLLAGFAAAVALANYVTSTYGLVDVAWLPAVTAGTFLIGVSFLIRDFLQDRLGMAGVLAGLAIGAAVSGLMSPAALVFASVVTFLVSELADAAVYTPLRNSGRRGLGWIASNVVGSIVDSALFLYLAGFPMSGFAGQAVVKSGIGILAAGVLILIIRLRRPNFSPIPTESARRGVELDPATWQPYRDR